MRGVHLYTLFDLRHRNVSAYQDIYDAFTAKPSDVVSSSYNRMVSSLINAGSWAKADVFQFYSTHTNDDLEAQLNWIYPSGHGNLLDLGKGFFNSGVEGWIPFPGSTNTVENDNGALKITYGNHAYGGVVALRENSDLNTNLTIGKTYHIRIKAKRNNIGACSLQIYNGDYGNVKPLSVDYEWYNIFFTAQSTDGVFMCCKDMGAGEMIWIDQWNIQEWTGAVKAETPTWEQYKGFTMVDTPRSYIKCSYNPNINAINYGLNDATLIIGSYANETDEAEFGCNDASSHETRINGNVSPAGNSVRVSVNCLTGNVAVSALNGRGHFGGTRRNSTQIEIWQNVSYDTVSQNSTQLPDREFYAGTSNTGFGPEYMDKQIRYVWVSSALTQGEYIATINAIETCLDSLPGGSGLI